MDWVQHAGLSERWQSLSRGYAAAVNGRLRAGAYDPDPRSGDDRADLSRDVLSVVREANVSGELESLRRRFAPAHAPFSQHVADQGQTVGSVFLLDDGRVAAVTGAPWHRPRAWMATHESVEPLLGVFALGRSADRMIYALGRAEGVSLTAGWGGAPQTVLQWPASYAPSHPDMPIASHDGHPPVIELIPFNDGERALMVSPVGVFLLAPEGSALIHPGAEDIGRFIDEEGDEAFPLDLEFVHADVSPDQAHLVVGDQASPHRVLAVDGTLIAAVEPAIGHPQQAAFTIDGTEVALSGRLDDEGRTVCVSIERVSAQLHWRPTTWRKVIEATVPVTAAYPRAGGFVLGDAQGFVRVWTDGAPPSGEMFVGGSVCAIDASEDGRTLLVGTNAGVLHQLELDPNEADPYAIGTRAHRERRRWIFWRSESAPLIW